MYLDIDSKITPAHQALKAEVHGFARDVLRPAASALDQLADAKAVAASGSGLWPALSACYQQGLHTIYLPKAQGGRDLDGLGLHIAMEELGWGSADFAISLAVTTFPFYMAALLGNTQLKQTLVQPFVADKNAQHIGCWAITEPKHGSDHFYIHATQFHDPSSAGEVSARLEGEEYILNGQKARWISNGTIATHAVVYLNVDPNKGLAGGGIAIVPLNLPGVTRGEPLNKLGQRALNQGPIRFEQVRIPRDYLLADALTYKPVLEQTLAFTNAAMGAIFTGVARAAFEEALTYTQARVQGGKPISEHQLVQKYLFDMFTQIETCRALSRAAMLYCRSGQTSALEYSTAAKIYCTQTAFEVTDRALQLFGGNGLIKEYLIEKLFRDARAALIEDGANDVLALSGARKLLQRYQVA